MFRPQVRHSLILVFLITLIFFLLYILTLAPGIMHWDMAEFQYIAGTKDLGHDAGFPLYRLVSDIVILLINGDQALVLNGLSAFFGALTVGFTFYSVFLLSKNHFVATIIATLTGIAHGLWFINAITEVYAMSAALFSALLLVCIFIDIGTKRRWTHMIFWIVIALSIMTYVHSVIYSLPLIIYTVSKNWAYYSKVHNIINIALIFIGVVTMAAVLVVLPYANGDILGNLKYLFFRLTSGFYKVIIFQSSESGILGDNFKNTILFGSKLLVLFFYSVPGVTFMIGLLGLLTGLRTKKAISILLFSIIITNLLSIVVPKVPDTFNLFYPSIICFLVLASFGLVRMIEIFGQGKVVVAISTIMIGSTLFLYRFGYLALDTYGVEITENRDNKYQLYPPKNDYTYSLEFSESTTKGVPPGSYIYSNWYFYFNLRYGKEHLAKRDDIHVINGIDGYHEEIMNRIDESPVFVSHRTEVPNNVYLVPFGYVYLLQHEPYINKSIEALNEIHQWYELDRVNYANKLRLDNINRGDLLNIKHFWFIKDNSSDNFNIKITYRNKEMEQEFYEECPSMNYSGKCITWRNVGYGSANLSDIEEGNVIEEEYHVVVPYSMSMGKYDIILQYRIEDYQSEEIVVGEFEVTK